MKHYEEDFDRRLEEEGLSDDELADLGNDRQYLAALVHDLQSHYEQLLKGSVSMQR